MADISKLEQQAKICKELKRHYIGCELVKEYCDVANEQDHPTEKGGAE